MTTQAVPIAPTVWILDRGDVWATLDQGELAERLSEEARNPFHWLLEFVRDVKWTIEVEIGSDRHRLTWGWETGPDEDSRIPDPGSGR